MFTLAPFLGGTYESGFHLGYALAALFGIFAPSFLLLAVALPVLESPENMPKLRAAIYGINTSVVGLLLAAFYNQVITLAIQSAQDVALALLAYLLMVVWKWPVAVMVPLFAGLGFLLY